MIKDQFQRPLSTLRISVIDACNFRCSYCMPIDKYPHSYRFLRPKERLSFAEIIRLVKIFTQLGVEKVRITGGEPLLRKDLDELIAQLAQIPEIQDLSLTTNGWYLPLYAQKLKAAGLDRVTVSLDSLQAQTFTKMTGGRGKIARVLEGITAALQAGFTPIKINAVIRRGVNDQDIMEMVEYFRSRDFILRFIEYMDVGNRNQWQGKEVVPSQEILQTIKNKYPLEPVVSSYGDVAKRYRYQDGAGEIGFISSVSQPFCRSCNRARISASGELYTCLFASKGFALRPLLEQSDKEILQAITGIWEKRQDRYSELRSGGLDNKNKVEMYHIGG